MLKNIESKKLLAELNLEEGAGDAFLNSGI
jgi:hypothetical protein